MFDTFDDNIIIAIISVFYNRAEKIPAGKGVFFYMNAFQEAPKSRKMITLVGIYLGILASLVQSSTLSTILPIASMEIGGMEIYPLASVVGGILSVVAMPLYGFLGAKNPALKRTLVLISLITGVIVLFTRAMAPSMMVIVSSTVWFQPGST
jgi:hypothetical protein